MESSVSGSPVSAFATPWTEESVLPPDVTSVTAPSTVNASSALAWGITLLLCAAFGFEALEVDLVVAHVAECLADHGVHVGDQPVHRLGDPAVHGVAGGLRPQLGDVHRLARGHLDHEPDAVG